MITTIQFQDDKSLVRIIHERQTVWSILVCSTPQLTPRIGLYTASVVSLKDALIGCRASNCDAPIQLLPIKIYTGNTAPSPTWRKQKAFPFPGAVALWVFCKSREFPAFFRGRGQSYARRHWTWNSLVRSKIKPSVKSLPPMQSFSFWDQFGVTKRANLKVLLDLKWKSWCIKCEKERKDNDNHYNRSFSYNTNKYIQLFTSMFIYCYSEPRVLTLIKFESKCHFFSIRYTMKISSSKCRPFCSGLHMLKCKSLSW